MLGPFFTVNRSFFMSLFFMISGYFTVGAYDRHGPGAFVRGRLVRLGIPVLFFAALMVPARIFLFGEHIARWDEWLNASHLWYLEHVLLFSLVYALGRLILRPRSGPRPAKPPGLLLIMAIMLVVAFVTGLVRIWSPIDRWFNLLGFFRAAFADVPWDLAFFIMGAVAYRRGWLESYPTDQGIACLAVGVAAAVGWYAWSLVPHPNLSLNQRDFAVARLLWEVVLCFGLCFGLPVLFREVTKGQGAFGRLLAANQYSACFWHPLLIVPLQMAALSLPLAPLGKFSLVTLAGVPIVFLWSWAVRKLRFVRAVL